MTIPNNPAPGREWTNDETGVTYKWDGDRWIVLSNSDEILQNYLPLTGGTLTGRLTAPRIAINGTSSENGRLFEAQYDGTTNAWINANGQVRTNFVLDDDSEFKTLTTKQYVDDKVGNIDLSGYVRDAEFEADQNRQDNVVNGIEQEQIVQSSQINALETQIQLLAQTQAVGKWTYRRNITNTLRPPATATFYGTDVDSPLNNVLNDWSKLQLIMVDKTDIDGTTYTFADFQEGDKLEILATDGSSACFGTVTNNPNVDGYGNLVIAVERSNGGPVEEATYLLSVYRPGANTGDTDLDALDGRYLKLVDANVVNPNFRIKSDSKVYISTAGDELSLYNVKEPTTDHHAATKSYVDSKTGTGIAPPAHLRWIWRNYDSTIDPGEGKFAWNSSSGFFRINYITADGINLGKSRPSTVDISFDTNLTGSIWYKDGDGWRLKQMFDVYRMQWDRNDCMWLYRRSIIVGSDSFTADVQYHITIGGLF